MARRGRRVLCFIINEKPKTFAGRRDVGSSRQLHPIHRLDPRQKTLPTTLLHLWLDGLEALCLVMMSTMPARQCNPRLLLFWSVFIRYCLLPVTCHPVRTYDTLYLPTLVLLLVTSSRAYETHRHASYRCACPSWKYFAIPAEKIPSTYFSNFAAQDCATVCDTSQPSFGHTERISHALQQYQDRTYLSKTHGARVLDVIQGHSSYL